MSSANTPAPSPMLPASVTQDRLREIVEERGWTYFLDSDGDLGFFMRTDVFYLFLRNNVLTVRGRWHITLRPEQLSRLRMKLNDWHREQLWPKAYVIPSKNTNRLQVVTEHAIDYEAGANDAQLLQHLQCSIATNRDLFDHLLSAFDL